MNRVFFVVLLLLGLLGGCSSEQGVEGRLLFQGEAVAGAQLEVYLQSGNQRSSTPFSVAASDGQGRYRLQLPAGSYYLVAKQKQQGGGQNRMLMAEAPANPYQVKGAMLAIPAFSLQEMGLGGNLPSDPNTWLEGTITAEGQTLNNAFVYVYSEPSANLLGPSYAKVEQVDAVGGFRLELPAGRYWLAARQRADGSRSGEPDVGDLSGNYSGNPVVISAGQQLRLGVFPLRQVAADKHQQRMAAGKFVASETAIKGRAVDDQGQPLAGIYVYAYRDSRMIGKPTHISAATATDGNFALFLSVGGNYFIGARSTFGGPLEPGEWVGTFDRQQDHQLVIEQGSTVSLGDLQLREVW